MAKVKKEVERTAVKGAFSRKRTVAGIILLVIAVVLIGSGFYLRSQPDWTLRTDIKAHNLGVSAYVAPPEALPPSEWRPSEYPMERAAAEWRRAATITTDKRVKSLALYNLATLTFIVLADNTISVSDEAQFDMQEGLASLKDALRMDPDNEDAKYNLELIERLTAMIQEGPGSPRRAYSPGGIKAGY
ncbi:MAG: hypothetical protein ABID54_08750 [Pseudomonadota bacterium]